MLEAATLILFPWLMAFAASTDLFTMTISNRISLALLGGFVPDGRLHRLAGSRSYSSTSPAALRCSC